MDGTVIEGTSGARVHLGHEVAVKVAPDGAPESVRARVVAQGAFMRDSPMVTTCFPRVHAVWDSGYVMDRLSPMREVPPPSVFTAVRGALSSLWINRTSVHGSAVLGEEHERYVRRLCEANHRPDVWVSVRAMLEEVRSTMVTVVSLTHGDPTLENCMLWGWGGVALVDPLPPEPKMPPLLAVDLGKMLQSARGYERSRRAMGVDTSKPYCDTRRGYREEAEECILGGESPEDRAAAEYMWRVHLLRLIPYQPAGEVREHFTGALRDALDL